MEMEKSSTTLDGNNNRDDEDEVMLPGFRFHPTDEELVGFYLRRKVEKKPISIELIKQIDIYKYDPWDLPKVSTVGEKEWYFFCIRGRKYRNSIRPNRVTGSGFWKATGIDKPIYSVGEVHECIGLKKSLVYYRGSAGKGTKTDWMMHEFRLPPPPNSGKSTNLTDVKNFAQEAEVWTLCRILKRNASYKKYVPSEWKNTPLIKQNIPSDSCSKTCSLESDHNNDQYLSFGDSVIQDKQQHRSKPVIINHGGFDGRNQVLIGHPNAQAQAQFSSFWNTNGDELFRDGNSWDELRSVVEFAIDPSHLYDCRHR